MIVAVHFILFPLGSIICCRLPIYFRQSLVMASRTAVAVAVTVRTARSRLVAVVIVVIVVIVVAVSVNLCEPRFDLPTVQRRREGHRVDLDVLPIFLREHRMRNT